MATATNNKPVRLGDLPVVKTNILENARQFDKGVVGGYSGVFPLSTASKGRIYLLPSTGKFYVCETAYNGAQISAPNSNFVELSVWKNHDRLSNLIKKINFNEIKTSVEINEDFSIAIFTIWKLGTMPGFVNLVPFLNINTESHFYFSHLDGKSCNALIKKNGNTFSVITRDDNYQLGFHNVVLIKN